MKMMEFMETKSDRSSKWKVLQHSSNGLVSTLRVTPNVYNRVLRLDQAHLLTATQAL